jgi:molybdopterin-guanine dinucleotide biosynthesis protein A
MADVVMGVFIGGRGRRMGGVNKALLPAPHDPQQTLAGRLIALGQGLGLEVVLLGASLAEFRALPQLPDARVGDGPLAGLASLLEYAGARPALAVACDLPYLTPALLARLLHEVPAATLLAARDPASGKWQALCARYHGSLHGLVVQALAQGERSFQDFFKRTSVTELTLSPAEHAQLHDWDTPDDVTSEPRT